MAKLGVRVEVDEVASKPEPTSTQPALVDQDPEAAPVVTSDGTPKKATTPDVEPDPGSDSARRLKSAQDIADGTTDLKTHVASPEDLAQFKEDMGHRYQRGVQFAKFAKADHPELFKNLSEAEIVAVWGYTTSDYGMLNSALRSKDPNKVAEVQAYIKAASSGLAKMPGWEGESFRGTSLPEEVLAKYKPGEVITEEAFTSSAATRDAKFDGNTEFVIQGKTGRDVSGVSEYADEKEILFAPGTKFEVTSKEVVNGKTVIKLREVTGDTAALATKSPADAPDGTTAKVATKSPKPPPDPGPSGPVKHQLWDVQDALADGPTTAQKMNLQAAKDALELADQHSSPKVKKAVEEVMDVDDPDRSDAIADILRDVDDHQEAARQIRALKTAKDPHDLTDEAAARSDELFTAPNQADVQAAKNAMREHDQVTTQQSKLLIEDAVLGFRKMVVDEAGGEKSALDAPNLGGFCGHAQGSVEQSLLALGVHPEELAFHQTTTGSPDSPFADATEHYFTVAKMPGDKPYLVDPTFAQFLHQDVGKRLASTPEGKALALELTTKGYVHLTPEVAELYGRALTGGPGPFSMHDFLKPTKDLAHGGLDRTPSDDVQALFPERPSATSSSSNGPAPGSGAPAEETRPAVPVSSSTAQAATKPNRSPILLPHQEEVALRKYDAMDETDKRKVDEVLHRAKNSVETEVLLKTVAAGHSAQSIEAFAKEISEIDSDTLRAKTRLLDGGDGSVSLKQLFNDSCGATMLMAHRGEYDPIFSWWVRKSLDDPSGEGVKSVKAMQKAILNTAGFGEMQGQLPGIAVERGETGGMGQWMDGFLNAASAITGVSYDIQVQTDDTAAAATLVGAASAGHRVPVVITQGTGAHYVYAVGVVDGPDGPMVEFYDPWSGETVRRSQSDIAAGQLNIAGHQRVSHISLPSTSSTQAPTDGSDHDGSRSSLGGVDALEQSAVRSGLPPKPPDHETHHIVPIAILRDHPMFIEMRRRGILNPNDPSNLVWLPKTHAAATPYEHPVYGELSGLPVHSGSHPETNRDAAALVQMALAAPQEDVSNDLPGLSDAELGELFDTVIKLTLHEDITASGSAL